MTHFNKLSGKWLLNLILLMTTVFLCSYANAQVTKSTVLQTRRVIAPPSVLNMADFKKSPQYAKRKAAYDKATPAPKTKIINFASGPSLKITLDKNRPNTPVGVATKKIGSPKKTSSGGFDCTQTEVVMTANSDNFLNNDYTGTTANIYPGACYTYDHLTDGSWNEQKGARNPLTISTDNPNIVKGGHSFTVVQTPDKAHCDDAIATLFRGYSNVNGNESTSYQVTQADNAASYNLAIGAGASGYGVDVSNQYSTGNQSLHVHLTIDATKSFFTISAPIPDNGIFKDPNIEATPYLTMIGEVSYGIRILANADLQFSSQQEADNFKASYSGFGISANLNINYGSSSKNVTATINAYIVGGPGGVLVAYSLADLKNQINKVMAGANYQNARPIMYKSYSMAGDVINTTSETDKFTVRNCVPSDGGSPGIQDIVVSFSQGGDGKEQYTQFYAQIVPGISPHNPDMPMFRYESRIAGTQRFENNSTGQTIILTPYNLYKGKFDLATFQNAGGGRLMIGLVPGTRYDVWQITGIIVSIKIKPTAANPNGNGAKSIKYVFTGPNQLNLNNGTDTGSMHYVTLTFDNNFNVLQ